MNKPIYRLSFTSGGLFYEESKIIVSIFIQLQDWEKTKNKVFEENLLHFKRKSSLDRKIREILPRLQHLSMEELYFFNDSDLFLDKCYVLWVAICRYYPFIEQFVINVIRERFLNRELNVTYNDFNYFFERLAPYHPELERITENTYLKMRRSLFLILKEAQILNKKFEIQSQIPSTEFCKLFFGNQPSLLHYFPIQESNIWMNSKP
jgi:hypothetical protein